MPSGAEAPLSPADLAALYEDKARAELDRAEAAGFVRWSGEPLAGVALVKGRPGEADVEAGRALAGDDGEAAGRALEALGLGTAYFATCSRPVEGGSSSEGSLRRLALQLEAVDPRVVVALDAEAAEDVKDAFGVPALRFGRPVTFGGRTLLGVDGLEASLSDPQRKARVWRQLKSLARPGQDAGGE